MLPVVQSSAHDSTPATAPYREPDHVFQKKAEIARRRDEIVQRLYRIANQGPSLSAPHHAGSSTDKSARGQVNLAIDLKSLDIKQIGRQQGDVLQADVWPVTAELKALTSNARAPHAKGEFKTAAEAKAFLDSLVPDGPAMSDQRQDGGSLSALASSGSAPRSP